VYYAVVNPNSAIITTALKSIIIINVEAADIEVRVASELGDRKPSEPTSGSVGTIEDTPTTYLRLEH
jgi:ribosome maturation protein Sdo1